MTAARLVPVCPRGLRLCRPRPDPAAAQAVLLDNVAARSTDFDVIHWHIDWAHLPLVPRLGAPSVTTLHGRLDLAGLPWIAQRFPQAPFVSISDSQRMPLPDLNFGTVYHGLPADTLEPCFAPGGYLAFLGRITPEKGPDVAIRLACRAGLPLRIAAKVPRGDKRYFEEQIKPMVNGDRIRFVGEVDDAGKCSFLGQAAALIFPISWPEPFGLVMIEAMACGTPVIAFRHGSVPEVVEHGVTGFVVDTEDEALTAISRLAELDRRHVRAAFEARFTARKMAEAYLRHYAALSEAGGSRA